MSYLLEALRKSEQERQQQVPNLGSSISEWEESEDVIQTKNPWLMVIALMLVLICVLLAALVWRMNIAPVSENVSTIASSATVPTMTSSVAKESMTHTTKPIASTGSHIEVREKPMLTVRTGNKANIEVSVPATTPRAPQKVKRVEVTSPTQSAIVQAPLKHVYDLDVSIRAQLPHMTMNSHIYSTDPSTSFVMINNGIISVGQELQPGLRLEMVTPDGAVLSFYGEKFLLPAMSSFDP